MSKDSILLSKKHGVNPSIQLCFYCNECKGILLMGKLKDDQEAPRECVTDIEPCDKCKEKYKDYTLIVEVSIEGIDPNRDFKPTGRWAAIKKEYINEKVVKESPVALAVEDTFNTLINRGDNDDKNDSREV